MFYHLQGKLMRVQGVSVIMQNIKGGTRGTHMEHKSVKQLKPYHKRFQVKAKRIKKWKIVVQKPSFLKYRKILH